MNVGCDKTWNAEKALAFAREEAERMNHAVMGTLHLLFGLIKEGETNSDSIIIKVLDMFQINHENIKAEIMRRMPAAGDKPVSVFGLSYSPALENVMRFAREEADNMGRRDSIGIEHILLGLLREQDAHENQAMNLLKDFGLMADAARGKILMIVDRNAQQTRRQRTARPAQAPQQSIIQLLQAAETARREAEEHEAEALRRNLFGSKMAIFYALKYALKAIYLQNKALIGLLMQEDR